MAGVTFSNLSKSYGNVPVVKALDLTLKSGEFTVLLGPSGCGKTTLLRMLAGLEEVTEGEIAIDGRVVTDLHASERDIAMVFQSYALYPHLDVAGNIGFPLEVRGLPKSEIAAKVRSVAGMLGLLELLTRKPKQLSGGQRQRVALGRAMVRDPKVFLFDEPLSNLDANMREEMRSELIRFHRETGKSIVYVTHDQVEAMTMAQRIIVMRQGSIQQNGTPFEIYKQPKNDFVAQFVGSPGMNILDTDFAGCLRLGGAPLTVPAGFDLSGGQVAKLGIRPEDIRLGTSATTEASLSFPVRLVDVQPLGATMIIDLKTVGGNLPLIALAEWRDPGISPNSEIEVVVPISAVHKFAADGVRIC
ncbi:carbohydrate ABC transporter ATP-binding protein (CUT1 family) [Dongia mobilis]|uniref:Carbohydrate ABC transporter ATP-binding protein (CUT1 family) n=1 Tax=Dongia mobilis TaxID=578943 RepID=A0A4R6WEU9_9PROT|nr:ABC transporter ATP-binding protein [Dongia mobilis]TDQ78412.1 carbohydrate ABC transporter ATP-binding protein (CUT1 family) [Dongia mobilis]